MAQRVSEEIKENARKQAETVIKEAEIQADHLIELAQSRAHEVERGILDLRAHRTALRTDVRALITRLTRILDLQEEVEVEDNLRFLKRREEGAVSAFSERSSSARRPARGADDGGRRSRARAAARASRTRWRGSARAPWSCGSPRRRWTAAPTRPSRACWPASSSVPRVGGRGAPGRVRARQAAARRGLDAAALRRAWFAGAGDAR